MKHAITIVMCLLGLGALGQDTTYVFKLWTDSLQIDSVVQFSVRFTNPEAPDFAEVKYYNHQHQLLAHYTYSNYTNNEQDGKQVDYYPNGQIYITEEYTQGELESTHVYYPNGDKKRIDKYANGKLSSGETWDITGNSIPHTPFLVQPQFKGGEPELYRFLNAMAIYPLEAKDRNIQGTVYISFVVEKNGSTSEVTILQSPHELLSNEALRVMSYMPDWIPGKRDGKLVRIKYRLPMVFNLKY